MMSPHEGVGIEKTRDIVLDTIQRNQLAGMPIGNAQTLYNDGLTLLAQNKYKDAYARFRSAYQAAVNPTVR
jgi:TolA-binding protein